MSERGDINMSKEKFFDKIKAKLAKHSDVIWCVLGALVGCIVVGFIGNSVICAASSLIFDVNISEAHPFISDVMWVLFAVGGGVAGATVAIKYLPMRHKAVDTVRKFASGTKDSKSE